MKYLAWIGGVLVTLLVLIYVVVFTAFGNSLLKPIIQEQIVKQTKLPSKLKTLTLMKADWNCMMAKQEGETYS